mgnify:CR=1 FL=1
MKSRALRQGVFCHLLDAYIDRDRLGEYCPDEETKIITNGWFMHAPYQWPPKSGKVIPLTVSMYIDQADSKVLDTFFSDTSIKYLNDHGPVGGKRSFNVGAFTETWG